MPETKAERRAMNKKKLEKEKNANGNDLTKTDDT